MIAKSHRWQKTALAAAAAALFSLFGSNATALSLGRITVQSALGEPLRAEIDVLDINAEEAASIKASVALPDAFRIAGLDYNPAMAGLQATLQRHADGRAYIRLSSERSVNDPFVDMILEVNWATGRIVRDYTLLFDPPNLRQAVAPTPAQVPIRSSVGNTGAPGSALPPTAMPAAQSRSGTATTSIRPTLDKAIAPVGQVIVKSGDTASKIAAATKPTNVSLDQMLVALLRTNPTAFAGDNVNRIKAGSIVTIPSAEQVGATPAVEATQIVIAQSKDFNDFRRQLAGNAPTAAVVATDRKVSGSLQTTVEDKKASTTAVDKLTLSKGALQRQAAENQTASERNAKEASSRAAEISKNISDLSKLGAASSAVVPGPAVPVVAPASATPGLVALASPSAAPAASSSAVASTVPAKPASVAASTPVGPASALAKRPVPVPMPRTEASLVDGLIENPLVPLGAMGLIALLAFFGFYRSKQRKNASRVDSIFLESRLRPDSFFGASGGQSVDTNDNAPPGSSMVYSTSQLDAVDNVDPVAEADVYLAYGRDLQAEEILKDALRTNPGRIAIHQKLLDIFAKRLDTSSFETIATLAYKVTSGDGPDWARICELGLSIDPSNDLYLPGGQPKNPDGTPSRPAPLDFISNLAASAAAQAVQANETPVASSVDLDLDLDFSLEEQNSNFRNHDMSSDAEQVTTPLDLDFGLVTSASETFATSQEATMEEVDAVEFSLDNHEISERESTGPVTDAEDFKSQAAAIFGMTAPAPLETVKPDALSAPNFGMMEFDLGSLSLDLGDRPESESDTATDVPQDPLTTKLALAKEFSAIGDDDGARALLEEVISEASGEIKTKAQNALNNL